MRSHDRTAFARTYDEHVGRVFGFFGYRLGSRAEAEDLTQATFERALRSWRRFDPAKGSERTWLMTIAWNLLVDHYRQARKTASLDEVEIPDSRVESGAVDDLVSAELATALEGLGDREREILALRFGGDLTGPEIAEITDLSLANVQQITSRGLRKLRKRLEPVVSAVG
jgi:RNA polymerase sigma factor (sigma-70 family)